jgi:biopolymer transport protein ExbB/TolQ
MLTRLPQQTLPIRMRSTLTLVGLLAAVMGAVNALVGVARGNSRLEAISAGVAEAIITTAVVLLVVFPGLWIYNYLKSRRRGLP